MSITIYHNPSCGTSRKTLALLRQNGHDPVVVEYLKNPPSTSAIKALLATMGLSVRDILRDKGTPYAALDLGNPKWTDEQLLDFIEQHPVLLNRPIVVTPLGVRLCRPSERVWDILPDTTTDTDGEDAVANVPSSQAPHIPTTGLADALPALVPAMFQPIDSGRLSSPVQSRHAPRILLLYGSLRSRSFSRLVIEESARLLEAMGAEVRIYDPTGLPLVDDRMESHPKVQELRALTRWCEGMVWCSPERHGAMTGVMKTQIDWLPLSEGAVRPTQGKTLAVMQVCGGSQSFNAVNQMRILGRWMRMITIPNQSSVAKAYQEFDDQDRMKPSSYYDRIVDVLEELLKFTWLTRDVAPYLVDRYSERKESAAELTQRVQQSSM